MNSSIVTVSWIINLWMIFTVKFDPPSCSIIGTFLATTFGKILMLAWLFRMSVCLVYVHRAIDSGTAVSICMPSFLSGGYMQMETEVRTGIRKVC